MRLARPSLIAVLMMLCLTTLLLNGCGNRPKKSSAMPSQATSVAKTRTAVSKPEPEPQYPSPADMEDEDDDEPTVDPAAALKLSGDWVWLGNLTPTESFKVDRPNRYRLSIKANGWFEVQADCIKGEGLYEAHGNRIALALVERQGEGCENSHKNLFFSSLESAGSFRLVGDRLRFLMKREKLEMVFYRPR